MLSSDNRAFKYGDGLFDTLKYENGHVEYIEDHYFRLMSSMRMLRMKIPMYFTLEFYQDQILETINANPSYEKCRIRVTVFRKDGGFYTPDEMDIDVLIESEELVRHHVDIYEIELFKDYPILSGILSNIKTNNRIVNVLAGIYASEYNFNNCILMNEKKNIVEAMNANIFLIKNQDVITPSLSEGCINGIFRKKIIERLKKDENYNLIETAISPFELLKSDEVFISNSIMGIQPVTKYRKIHFESIKTNEIIKIMNIKG